MEPVMTIKKRHPIQKIKSPKDGRTPFRCLKNPPEHSPPNCRRTLNRFFFRLSLVRYSPWRGGR
jgi:hypothetical protein